MSESLRVLMAQINTKVGSIQKNAEAIVDLIKAEQSQHDLIIFPELALSGYPPEDLLFCPAFYKDCEDALAFIKTAIHDCHVILGYPSYHQGKRYNAAGVFYQQQTVAVYNKQALPNYGVFDEARYFSPGEDKYCIVDIQGFQLAILICEDIWAEEPLKNLNGQRVDALVCLNASPFDTEKYQKRVDLLRDYANQWTAIFYVNLVGGQDELVFDGQSFVLNKQGKLAALAQAFKEDKASVLLYKDRVEGSINPKPEPIALLYEALVCGIRDYVEKNGFPSVLLGLSGGIDSALTLILAVDALGPKRVHALMMPSRYSADISLIDAEEQLEKLQVLGTLIPIEPAFTTLLTSLSPFLEGKPVDTTEENIQARIRGLLLMAVSNKTGAMVLTTSNKSETAVGYSTLYGDMAGGFAPLKDVLKTEVYALARYRNSLSEAIPERVISRPPSAELAPNQRDQDSLPDYSILDAIIRLRMEQNLSAQHIIEQGFEAETVYRVLRLLQGSEYKRRQAAPGIKISARAFGRDWRFPISSGFLAH